MKKLIKNIRIILLVVLNKYILRKPDFSEKNLFLQGKIIANANEKKDDIETLKDVEFSAFSQFGEDGIIDWVINKIPNIEKIFLEIGTQDYWESNTRFLLKSRNWKGYIFEGSKKDILKIKSQQIYWQNDLKAVHAFVDKENINQLIKDHIQEKNIGLLSIDIDGNDYWILDEIEDLSPSIIVCEYNSIFGDKFKLSVPYDKNFIKKDKHYSNLYFGSSINAIVSLLEKKQYFFLGTSSRGINAFFVKNEFKSFFSNKIKYIVKYPSIAREALDQNGNKKYENILKEKRYLENLDVFDFDENKIKKISEYKELYSEEWKKLLK